jgi:hypothetical protein
MNLSSINLLIIAFLLFVFSSCEKDINSTRNKLLQGNWKLVRRESFYPLQSTPFDVYTGQVGDKINFSNESQQIRFGILWSGANPPDSSDYTLINKATQILQKHFNRSLPIPSWSFTDTVTIGNISSSQLILEFKAFISGGPNPVTIKDYFEKF